LLLASTSRPHILSGKPELREFLETALFHPIEETP
jgi:hypothetical protein